MSEAKTNHEYLGRFYIVNIVWLMCICKIYSWSQPFIISSKIHPCRKFIVIVTLHGMDLEINIKTEWMHCIDEHDMFKLPQTTSPWAKKSSSKKCLCASQFHIWQAVAPTSWTLPQECGSEPAAVCVRPPKRPWVRVWKMVCASHFGTFAGFLFHISWPLTFLWNKYVFF